MFEFLKELFFQLQHHLMPFTVIHVYERGVRLRLGKNPTLLNPGLKWKWPLADDIFTCIITVDTLATHPVHITTTDEKTITVTPVIEFIIEDPIKWLMETNEAVSNLHDLTRGVVADHLTECSWEECKKKTTDTEIKRKLNSKVSDMGAKVARVMLADMCISRVYITQL